MKDIGRAFPDTIYLDFLSGFRTYIEKGLLEFDKDRFKNLEDFRLGFNVNPSELRNYEAHLETSSISYNQKK